MKCIDLNLNSGLKDEELKLLKWQHLILIANYRDTWIVRVPPASPDALPFQANLSARHGWKEQKASVGLNAESVISTLLIAKSNPKRHQWESHRTSEQGLAVPSSSKKSRFQLERHEDALEFRALMCVVRLCNVALGRYSNIKGKKLETVGDREWNAWYIVGGEVRTLEILRKTAASEAHKLRRYDQDRRGEKTAATNAAMTMQEEGACPLNYSLPLLDNLLRVIY
jgi:hypothetical protein